MPSSIYATACFAAERWPGKIAVVDSSGEYTFRAMLNLTAFHASRLRAMDAAPGDRVLVQTSNTHETLAIIAACSSLQAIAVLVSVDSPPNRWAEIRKDTGAVIEHKDGSFSRLPAPDDCTYPDAVDGATLMLYTSGSTATPKAILCTEAQVAFAADAVQEVLHYSHDDAIICRLPLNFDYGLYQWLLSLRSGSTLVLVTPSSDLALLLTLRQYSITVLPVVPTLAAMLVKLARGQTFESVRLITNTGERLPESVRRQLRSTFPNARVQLMFGISECKRVSIAPPDHDLECEDCVGEPLPGTHVQILGEDGKQVAPGVAGEIVVFGPHVMSGYWRRPRETEQRFGLNGPAVDHWLRTGDQGWTDPAGHLHFLWRLDDVFKFRGNRVGSREIVGAAEKISGVDTAVLIPPKSDTELTLVYTGDVAEHRVRDALRRNIESSKMPTRIIRIPVIPVTPNGKTDYVRLDDETRAG